MSKKTQVQKRKTTTMLTCICTFLVCSSLLAFLSSDSRWRSFAWHFFIASLVVSFRDTSRISHFSSANVFTLLRVSFKWNVFIFIDDFIIIDLIFCTMFCHPTVSSVHVSVTSKFIILIVSHHDLAPFLTHLYHIYWVLPIIFEHFTKWLICFHHLDYPRVGFVKI